MRNTLRILGLAGAALLAAPGCGTTPAPGPQTPPAYRTVRAEPNRDTDAARAANTRGLELLAQDDLAGASEAFARALTADVEFGPAHNNLGKVYYLQRDWYRAAWEFEYAKKTLPGRPEPHNNLGLVLEAGGELDRAVEAYRQAVDLDPADVTYKANLARTLVRRGDDTDELRGLLADVIALDGRTAWKVWATHESARLGGGVAE